MFAMQVTKGTSINMTTEQHSSYFKEFKSFCSIYKDRENHLSEAILEFLQESFKRDKEIYHILDVGSSDGALLEALIKRLPSDTKNRIEINALEPDNDAFFNLKKKFDEEKDMSKNWTVDTYLLTIEDFSLRKNFEGKYDLILLSHVLYHIDPAQWINIISTLKKRLKTQGKIIVILDSYDSPIYQFKKEITPFLKENYYLFGGEISAEMFQKFLIDQEIVCQYHVIESNLLIQRDEGINYLRNVLSFLYRREINETYELRTKLDKWANKYIHKQISKYYKFSWKEIIFEIP